MSKSFMGYVGLSMCEEKEGHGVWASLFYIGHSRCISRARHGVLGELLRWRTGTNICVNVQVSGYRVILPVYLLF